MHKNNKIFLVRLVAVFISFAFQTSVVKWYRASLSCSYDFLKEEELCTAFIDIIIDLVYVSAVL